MINYDKNIFHTYFQNLAKSENVYFLFSDYSFVKFITTALTMYLDVKSQDKSERPLVNRSDFSVKRGQIVCSNLTPNAAVSPIHATAVARSTEGEKTMGSDWLTAVGSAGGCPPSLLWLPTVSLGSELRADVDRGGNPKP